MSGLLSRPLSPIIESPPTTPQKQPVPHQDQPNAGFQSIHPPPPNDKEPKSVKWGDLVAYRTIETRRDDEGRSLETDEGSNMTVRIDPKRFSDQSNISTATTSSLFSTASITSVSAGEDLPPLSAEGIRLEAEKTGGKKRRSGTKDLFKRYVERFRPGKAAEEKDVVEILYQGEGGTANEPVVSILNPSPEAIQTGRVYDSPSSSGNPSTLTPPPSLASNPASSSRRPPSPRHQRSASIFIPPRRVDTPTLGLMKGNQPVPPILERQARISGTFGPPKGSLAEVPDEVKGKGQTETVRATALQPFPGVVLDLGPALPISDGKQVLTDTTSGSAMFNAPNHTITAEEKSPNSQARDLGWIRVPRGRPRFGMGRRTLSDPNIPTIYEFEPLKTDDPDLETEGNGRMGAKDRHEVVRMLKEELTYGEEDPAESHSSGSTGPPVVNAHEQRRVQEGERKPVQIETTTRPHTAWDLWRRPTAHQTGPHQYPGECDQKYVRQRKPSLNKDLPRLPAQVVPRDEPGGAYWNYPRQSVDQRSELDRDKNVGWHAWKRERRESMGHHRDTGSQHRAPSPLVSPGGHEFPRFTSPVPIAPRTHDTGTILARPGTPMPPSSSSMPLLLASALLSQQASQILIELSAIPAAGPEDDKLDNFRSRMRQLATEGNEVGRGLMDCVIGQEPDRPASANALKRARSDLSGINQDAMMPEKRSRRISLPADMHFTQPVYQAYQETHAVSPRYDHREDARQNEIWQMQAMLDQAHEMIQGLQANLDVLRPNVGPDPGARAYEHDRGRRRRTFWGGWTRR